MKQGFLRNWEAGIKLRKENQTEYPIENFLNEFLKEYNIVLSLDQCIEAIRLFYTEYINSIYYEENLYETLSVLKNKSYKIGVISNTCYYEEIMKDCFKKANIYQFIDAFTFSYPIKIAKPNKQIYKIAMRKFNIIPPQAVMIGDSLKNDIEPAIELDMKTIWLNQNGSTNKLVNPNFEISNICEISKYL